MLIDAGIPDVKTLRKLGPIDAFRRLRFHFGKRVSTNFAYAIECALRGMDWRLLEPARKAELKEATHRIATELERSARR
jgi:DNA transformation protein